MNKVIAAKIEGSNISLLDRNGNRIGYAGSPGLSYDERWANAYVNGNIVVGTTTKGRVVTWEIRGESTAVVVGRR